MVTDEEEEVDNRQRADRRWEKDVVLMLKLDTVEGDGAIIRDSRRVQEQTSMQAVPPCFWVRRG